MSNEDIDEIVERVRRENECYIDDNVKYLITQDKHINGVAEEIKKQYDIEVLSPFQFYTKYKTNKL